MNRIDVYNNGTTIDTLTGKTLSRVEKVSEDRIEFDVVDGERYVMSHLQDCCESVYIEDINGDLSDLVGHPILHAEEVTYINEDPPEVKSNEEVGWRECWTWTFYKIYTIKGGVTLRWLGESNGYYSESVDIVCLPKERS